MPQEVPRCRGGEEVDMSMSPCLTENNSQHNISCFSKKMFFINELKRILNI